MGWLGILGVVMGVMLLGIAVWWWRASRKRCPIDGGVRCRNCVYDEPSEPDDDSDPPRGRCEE